MDLGTLNSLTKYPSIPTYHHMDNRGGLTDETVSLGLRNVIGTEKIDGTNARIILPPDGMFQRDNTIIVGSREELLSSVDDLILNPALGIVDTLGPVYGLVNGLRSADDIRVLYLEVFGGKIGKGGKNYSTKQTGYRLFDVATIPSGTFGWDRPKIAEWREGNGQSFADEHTLGTISEAFGIPLVPRLFDVPADQIPTSIEDTAEWLTGWLPGTFAALDDSAQDKAEGIVLRMDNRAVIAKARFEDYERTVRRRA